MALLKLNGTQNNPKVTNLEKDGYGGDGEIGEKCRERIIRMHNKNKNN